MNNTKDRKRIRKKKRRKEVQTLTSSIMLLVVIFGVFGVLYYLIDNVIFPTSKDIYVSQESKTDDTEKTTADAAEAGKRGEEPKADQDRNITEVESGQKSTEKISRYELIHSGTIYEGISIDELDVSGMNYDKAIAAYSDYVNRMSERKIVFKDALGTYSTTFSEAAPTADVEAAVCDALTYGRTGNILNRFKEIKLLEDEPVTIVPEKTIDTEVLKNQLENEAGKLTKSPVNASMSMSNGDFVVFPGEEGLGIEYDKTMALIREEIDKTWEQKDLQIDIVTKVLEPEYSEDDFYGVDSLLGRAVTEYNSRNTERISNLIVGTEKIADNVVLPGEQFSVYDTVAPFTEENGYRNAGQYINAELVDGLGGGICQVATTLYDAVLEAELQVDERYPHSMTVSYVKKGMDAAIAEGYEDLKFTNNTGYPIYIDAYTGGGSISIAIYGHETRSSNRRIEFESQIIETFEPGEEKTVYDDTIPEGTTNVTEAHTGYYVELWKNIYENGELIDSVKINGSQYSAISRTTRIGTKKE